jgi:hypothetical protein
MKKLILIFLIAMAQSVIGQVILENIYPNGTSTHFEFIKLDTNDYKYALFDPLNSQFTLYNLNHSIYLNVTIPITYVSGSAQYTIAFVSKSLFDCDTSNIEYALSFVGSGAPNSSKSFYVYRTDGTQLSNIDSCCFINFSDGWKYGPEYNKPIVNTPTGTKLLLRHLDGSIRVYSVCGTLPTETKEIVETQFMDIPFPNPTNTFITIPYQLPTKEKFGIIKIYDDNGNQIKTYNVDGTFKNLTISTSELRAGTYYFQLVSSKGLATTKKVIKVE